MILSKENLKSISKESGVVIPQESILALPEKVLQFGTGVLLRGLPDYYIDKANRNHIFNGRIVVVKSTASGGVDAFDSQDALYTVCVRGIEDGNKVDKAIINSSISRVISAKEQWSEVLKCAANPEMQLIISNTTEVGIVLNEKDKVTDNPPSSFPGKLLAFLVERYKIFNGNVESGMVIIPTELIPGNGTKLKNIVIELAKLNELDETFINWLITANDFCNSLVDRIVPGKLPAAEQKSTEEKLGYTDELMIMSECYSLWAIETSNARTKQILSFSKVDDGVVIAPDINVFRELKLRLLNGTHTFSCGLAFLAGCRIVKEAMDNQAVSAYVSNLMLEEIAPAILYEELSMQDAEQFSAKVLDRFRNPHIDHQWISITMQFSSKMRMRNLPILLKHYEKKGTVPQLMALGFAAYILFLKSEKKDDKYIGTLSGTEYVITDDRASALHEIWKNNATTEAVAHAVLSDADFWGSDLSQLNGFEKAVSENLELFVKNGVAETLKQVSVSAA